MKLRSGVDVGNNSHNQGTTPTKLKGKEHEQQQASSAMDGAKKIMENGVNSERQKGQGENDSTKFIQGNSVTSSSTSAQKACNHSSAHNMSGNALK